MSPIAAPCVTAAMTTPSPAPGDFPPPPGWYPSPDGSPEDVWWDGERWGQTRSLAHLLR